MRDEYEIDEKEKSAADVLSDYSKFVLARIGYRCRPGELRLHLMEEISGLPSNLKRKVPKAATYHCKSDRPSSSGQ